MPMRLSASLKNFLLFLSILLALSAIYLPTLQMQYLHHDDFRFWEKMPAAFPGHPFYDIDLMTGRPLGAYIIIALDSMVKAVEDLNIIRFLTILQLSLCGSLYAAFLRSYFPNTIITSLIAIVVLTLPPFEILISYAANCATVPSVLLSLGAALCVNNIPLTKPFYRSFLHINTPRAIVLLFMALLIYPSTAAFYWVIATTIYLFSQPKPADFPAQRLLNLFCIGLGTTALYGFYLKAVKNSFTQHMGNSYNPYVLTQDWLGKIKWFLREPLLNGLNLWNIFPRRSIAITIVVFITATWLLTIGATKGQTNKSLKRKYLFMLSKLGVLVSLMLLSFLPNLLSATDAAFYRCCTGPSVIVLLLLIWALNRWLAFAPQRLRNTFMTAILFLGSFYGIIQARINVVYYRIIPSQTEFHYILEHIQQADLSRYKKILIIPAQQFPAERYDEFVTSSSRYPQDGSGIKNCVFNELHWGGQPFTSDISLHVGQNVAPHESILIIDMRKLYSRSGKLAYLQDRNRIYPAVTHPK
jgi:hypothetical protein